jgi:hypothetical protein
MPNLKKWESLDNPRNLSRPTGSGLRPGKPHEIEFKILDIQIKMENISLKFMRLLWMPPFTEPDLQISRKFFQQKK